MALRVYACLASFLVLASADEYTSAACDIDFEHRVDAHDGEWPLSECEARGFCWAAAPADMPAVPWCFHKLEIDGHATAGECAAAAASASGRVDCAADDEHVTPRSCTDHGCCWASSTVEGDPWCFRVLAQEEL
jgi:hypothetical protein